MWCFLLFGAELYGDVVKVYDGDTMTVAAAGQTYKIRLAQIDAPERKQEHGLASRDFLATLTLGREVRVDYEKKDRYGRIIGQVYFGVQDINLSMVLNGHAWVYEAYSQSDLYDKAQTEAKTEHRGLWAEPNPIPPWDYRKAH